MTQKFKKDQYIRENRQGSRPEQIMDVTLNIIETYAGNTYHVTKVRKV